MLSKGMKNQLTKQLGEYLAAAELSRRGVVCTTFMGNMSRFDLLAMNSKGDSQLIQVKARTKGSFFNEDVPLHPATQECNTVLRTPQVGLKDFAQF